MGARGRRSSTELTLLRRAEEDLVVRRPDPPDHLSDEARMEWREGVNSLPADYFSRGMHPLLEEHCRFPDGQFIGAPWLSIGISITSWGLPSASIRNRGMSLLPSNVNSSTGRLMLDSSTGR